MHPPDWLLTTGRRVLSRRRRSPSARLAAAPAAVAAAARVVVIVSAHEPDPDDLHDCVTSVLDQRGLVVDEVHVVDDGSTLRPVRPFSHPRVRWHRTSRGGRCAARAYVLDRLEPAEWDFVMTLDGHCVLDEYAVAHLLQAFARPETAAAAGALGGRNAGQNLLTRIGDAYLGASCVPRRRRSSPGLPGVVFGAPVAYRAAVAFRRGQDCLTAGSHDDGRCLAVLAGLDGEVIGTRAATAAVWLPAGVQDAYRQWLRWSAMWWRLIPSALTGVRRSRAGLGRLRSPVGLVAGAPAVDVSVVIGLVGVWADSLPWPALALCAAPYLLARYVTTGRNLAGRPGTSPRAKLLIWSLLAPAEVAFLLLFVVPIRYVALFRICRRRWVARRHEHRPSPFTTSVAGRGAIYYSGHLLEGNRT